MNKVQVAGITKGSVVDGLGMRTVVYFQGCPRHCSGCHNPETISTQGGREMTATQLVEEICHTINPLIKGVTFSGGDPLMQPDGLQAVIKLLKEEQPHLDIWVYTGYTFEEVKYLPVMELIDVLVDGPFVEAQRDIALAFRGSSNQRLIDIPQTLATGEVKLLKLDTE